MIWKSSNWTRTMKPKNFFIWNFLFLVLTGYAQEQVFSEAALNDILITENGDRITFGSVLEENTGRTIFLDIWASWCKDCIVGMPKVKQLKKKYPQVAFVYISLDRNETGWKNGIRRFGIEDGLHYWATKGWDSDLFSNMDLDWIPRYMILDHTGAIKLFRAIKADDKEILNYLKNEEYEK